MDKYYYLATSLPLLQFGQKPFIARDGFIAEAKKWLSENDFRVLSNIDINNFIKNRQDTPLLRTWKEFEFSIREELAGFRAAKRKNAEYKIRRDLAEIVLQENNPLEAEKQLLLLRWNFLEQQEIGHYFDLDFLAIYCLKLQLLERLFSFDKQKGKERFESFSLVEL